MRLPSAGVPQRPGSTSSRAGPLPAVRRNSAVKEQQRRLVPLTGLMCSYDLVGKGTQVAAAGVTAVPQWHKPPLARTHSAAENCVWFVSAAAALICLVAGTAVQGQTGPSVDYDRAVVTESICRQYAAALTEMPADLMFKQCIGERHCQPVPSPPGYWCAPPPLLWGGNSP